MHLSGKQAEHQALKLYQQHGFQLLHQNFKTPFGEIDLVLRKNNILYLLEVKSTKSNKINPYGKWKNLQKQRLIKVFKYYLDPIITFNYSEIQIHFLWFALDYQNRLKLEQIIKDIEIDYG